MKMSVGIEALAVALPRRTLHLEDLARARGVDPAKYVGWPRRSRDGDRRSG